MITDISSGANNEGSSRHATHRSRISMGNDMRSPIDGVHVHLERVVHEDSANNILAGRKEKLDKISEIPFAI